MWWSHLYNCSFAERLYFSMLPNTKYLFQNGDYSYDIPEQYATSDARTRYCRLSEGSDNGHIFKGKLCGYCNKRESLKLSELSNFEPKSERLFDTELKVFKEYLEVRYPLCDNCKLTVRDVLRRQTLWLTCYKMLFFRRKPIKTLVSVSIFAERTSDDILNVLYVIKYFLT